jgi:NADPH-dependent methylglyoxal reductase
MSKLVLLTGASGFVAGHILKQLNEQGYEVLGTVRSESKGEFLKKRYPSFDYEIVTDISTESAFDGVFKSHPDIQYVLHTASPFHYQGDNPEKDLLIPAINGTKSVLSAAHKYGPNVKKIVITSSFAAIIQYPFNLSDPEFVYTEKYWNNITYEQAKTNHVLGYFASKTFAERAAWDFIKDKKPQFTITTVQIPFVFGPPINDIGLKSINTSNQIILNILCDSRNMEFPGAPLLYIDVRDAAATHIIAMTSKGLDNKRCFSACGVTDNQLLVDTVRKVRPQYTANIKHIGRPGSSNSANFAKFDNSETQKYLQLKYKPLEESLGDTVDWIISLKEKKT